MGSGGHRSSAFPSRGGNKVRGCAARVLLQDVDEQEQAQPHHVDEVPVPGHRLEREVVVLAEVALGAAQPDDREHDRAQGHVRAVEAGEHEERRAVDARTQGQVRSEEHTSELQSLMRISYAVFCLKKKNKNRNSISTIKHSIRNT